MSVDSHTASFGKGGCDDGKGCMTKDRGCGLADMNKLHRPVAAQTRVHLLIENAYALAVELLNSFCSRSSGVLGCHRPGVHVERNSGRNADIGFGIYDNECSDTLCGTRNGAIGGTGK